MPKYTHTKTNNAQMMMTKTTANKRTKLKTTDTQMHLIAFK